MEIPGPSSSIGNNKNHRADKVPEHLSLREEENSSKLLQMWFFIFFKKRAQAHMCIICNQVFHIVCANTTLCVD